ncbi:MAG: DHH family phosphoesterase [Candidatus Magasanikbacteria bacterium]|nr:DHH family phosphoesterase [Candidatus Magasanikbacteria bacterium]
MAKIIVTSYKNADLDGVACAIAYAEFLNKHGSEAKPLIAGQPHKEARFVLEKFGISTELGMDEKVSANLSVIFLDASDTESLPNGIQAEQVIEIIDHRQFNETNNFSKAKIQLELVGACATLIAEKFYSINTEISKDSAALLYCAIVSNTLNFKGSVTTERDIKMAQWLKNQIQIPENFEYEMFMHKSNLDQPLKEILLSDFKTFDLNGKKVSIAQLEILDKNDYIKNNLVEIKLTLEELKNEQQLDYLFLNFIDLEKGINSFVVIDKHTEELLSQVLIVQFKNSVAHSDKMILRKEIYPLIKNILNK